MIDHMVWIKFKEGVTQARIAEHMTNLSTLADHVPGIVACHAGENFTDRAKGFTHGLRVTLESRDALNAYLPHPKHIEAAAPMKDDAADVMALDIEY